MRSTDGKAQRLLVDTDSLMRCLVDCELDLDGETVHVRASKECNPNESYRQEVASEIYNALRDIKELQRTEGDKKWKNTKR